MNANINIPSATYSSILLSSKAYPANCIAKPGSVKIGATDARRKHCDTGKNRWQRDAALYYFQCVTGLECPGCADNSNVVGILVTDWTILDFFVKRGALKAVKQLLFGVLAVICIHK